MTIPFQRNRQCHLYLSQFLLKISADCHPNPGPRTPKFPCLVCKKAVKNDHNSVQCETCERWGHVECLGITEERFQVLVDYSFAWICPACDSQNVTQLSSSNESDLSLNDTTAPQDPESDISIQDHSTDSSSQLSFDAARSCSTPKSKYTEREKKNRLSCIVVNTQSIMPKKESLWQILESENPDIILACETWLKPDIHDSEIIPADLEYEIFRKDRKDGYGGVMIGVKRQLVYEHVPTSENSELVAVKVTCKHTSVIVASLYRTTNNDLNHTVNLTNAIESLVKRYPKEVIWIGGDANLPDINWSLNTVSGNNYKKEINVTFLQAVENSGLDQVVDFQTSDDNLLDIFLTNRPSLIQSCKSLPGISDHEIVYVESDVSVKYQRPIRRKIWLWSKADLPSMKEDMNSFSDEFIGKYSIEADVDTMWTEFSSKCTQLMTDYIPSKLSTARFSQP